MTTNSTITPELLDQLLANYTKPEDLTGEDGLFKQLKKALIERALGAELGRTSVTVNAVCPGYTETDMMSRAIANITSRTGRNEAEARELMAKGNPGGRIATADEVARAVLELIEGTRTGTAVVIPGGATA